MTQYPLHGSCYCGAVRYRIETAPMFVNCCHCTECQKQTSSAFAINAVIETDRITLETGMPEAVEMHTESGSPHDIYRCPGCKTALWSDYGHRPALRFLRVATLDDPSALPPMAHIFTRSKLQLLLPQGVPAFEIYYDMQSLWPAESLARREVILGKGK